MSAPSFADLECEACGRVTEHELRYAGRLLESTRCTRCGTLTEVTGRARVPAYVHDLEHRVLSKPARMLRRVTRDPGAYVRGLPRALARQPGKFLGELRELLRR